MRFKAKAIENLSGKDYSGISIGLQSITAVEFDKLLTTTLKEFYEESATQQLFYDGNPVTLKPSSQSIDFDALNLGFTKVRSHQLVMPDCKKPAYININYYLIQARGKPIAGVDYSASSAFAFEDGKLFQGFTLFFNTFCPGFSPEENIERRDSERDAFLDYLTGPSKNLI